MTDKWPTAWSWHSRSPSGEHSPPAGGRSGPSDCWSGHPRISWGRPVPHDSAAQPPRWRIPGGGGGAKANPADVDWCQLRVRLTSLSGPCTKPCKNVTENVATKGETRWIYFGIQFIKYSSYVLQLFKSFKILKCLTRLQYLIRRRITNLPRVTKKVKLPKEAHARGDVSLSLM